MRPPLPTMGSTPWSRDRGTTRDQVRPHGFSPPRRFRHTTVSGSIAPQNQTGSAAFPIRVTRIRRWWPLTYLPQQRIHTLRRFPLAGSRTASLRPLPPRRSPSHRTESTSRSIGLSTTLARPAHRESEDSHPHAGWSLLPSSLRLTRPWTVDRLDALLFPAIRLPRSHVAHTPLCPPTRFFVDDS